MESVRIEALTATDAGDARNKRAANERRWVQGKGRCEQRVDGFGEAKKAKLLDLDSRVCGWLAVCIFQFMRVSKGAISNTGLM